MIVKEKSVDGRQALNSISIDSVSEMINTERLVNSLKAKDLFAFSELYDLYSSSLYSILLKILHTTSEAEQALQMTFIDAWILVDTYDAQKRPLFLWLLGIAKKRAFKMLQPEPHPTIKTALNKAKQNDFTSYRDI